MSADVHQDKVLILDFGSQYTQLIARRVRELGVYCELYAWDVSDQAIRDFSPNGIILSGGPESALADTSPTIAKAVFDLGVPVLGICYGLQIMAAQLGGEVETGCAREYGYAKLQVLKDNPLFKGLSDEKDSAGNDCLEVWMSHGDRVKTMPAGFEVIGASEHAPIAAIADVERQFYGLQFHPEVTHTLQGKALLSHFVHDICGCQDVWRPDNIIEASIKEIQEKVGQDEVILGLSGGVDSSVVAALLHRAIGDQLTCIFVDTGLLRYKEGEEVKEAFDPMGLNVKYIDASDRFLSTLSGVTDPEEKRKICGRLFVEVFQEESLKCKNAKWLAQGTIYPDVIESAGSETGKAKVIKSHHNVGGLPESMSLKLLEPLRELFKDEVREIGLALGLSYERIHRHPFPGPGLALRVLEDIKPEYVELLQKADKIFLDTLYERDWYYKVHQAFAVFLPVKSVGVVGDNRVYDHVIALRAIETIDFMTAKASDLPFSLLTDVAHRIVNEVPGISRVVYDISGKPPATIEWE